MKINPYDRYSEEYENWFVKNESIFLSELRALQLVIPSQKIGLEIGVGSGLFAEKLSIQYGVDPSEKMLEIAKTRKVSVVQGYAEDLPFQDEFFDYAAFITSLCFISNPAQALKEAYRVVKSNGHIIVAYIDKESSVGKMLSAKKETSKFYKNATFFSVPEMCSLIESNNWKITQIFQTLFDENNNEIEIPLEGCGIGSFIVINAQKQ